VTPAIGFYRARVAFSFAHSILLAGYGRIVVNGNYLGPLAMYQLA